MPVMQNKKRVVVVAVIGLVLILLFILKPWDSSKVEKSSVRVTKGIFETYITEMGELKAQSALYITVPEVSYRRELDIWEMKILDIVEEGKIVKKGDHVATLDPSEVMENLRNVDMKLDKYNNELETAKLDSSLTLSSVRESIQKAKDHVLDKEIKLEQSTYESKAVQRQSKLELEQAQRSLAKAKRDLQRQERKMKVTINRYLAKIDKYEGRKKLYLQLQSELDIKSPADGMIVYGYGYDGKVKTGSHVGKHAPLIATLPDLSSLISEMYVKEVNIAKIAIGNKVRISVDALPDNEFTGEIISIANIGQQIPGEYQNGFKVDVRLDPFHVDLRPGMTATNVVITGSWEDALIVPKKAVFGNDSLRYVMIKSGLNTIKQKIEIGGENDKFFRVTSGLEVGDVVLVEDEK